MSENPSYWKGMFIVRGQWAIHDAWKPELLPVVDLPPTDSFKYKIGETVYLRKNGIDIPAKITNLHCRLWNQALDEGWRLFYECKWTGSGHTSGYFLAKHVESYNEGKVNP
jgi:hypothetical protein